MSSRTYTGQIPDAGHTLDWMGLAACRDHDPDLWHSTIYTERQAAIQICEQCPVRPPCRRWADQVADDEAILGATTPERRRWERRQNGPSQPRTCKVCGTVFAARGTAVYCRQTCRDTAARLMRHSRPGDQRIETIRTLAAAGWADTQIGHTLGLARRSVGHLRQRFGIPAGTARRLERTPA